MNYSNIGNYLSSGLSATKSSIWSIFKTTKSLASEPVTNTAKNILNNTGETNGINNFRKAKRFWNDSSGLEEKLLHSGVEQAVGLGKAAVTTAAAGGTLYGAYKTGALKFATKNFFKVPFITTGSAIGACCFYEGTNQITNPKNTHLQALCKAAKNYAKGIGFFAAGSALEYAYHNPTGALKLFGATSIKAGSGTVRLLLKTGEKTISSCLIPATKHIANCSYNYAKENSKEILDYVLVLSGGNLVYQGIKNLGERRHLKRNIAKIALGAFGMITALTID